MAGDADKDKLIARLKRQLQEKEDSLKLSAEIGKSLLQQNNDLEIKCESLSQEHSHRVEDLEQEKHSLQLRISTAENMQKNQQSEFESQHEQLVKESQQDKEREQVKHSRIVQQLQTKLDSQQADLEMAAMTEQQLKDKVTNLEEMLKCAHEKLKSLENVIMPADDGEELMTLRQSNNVLKSEKDFLQIELKGIQDKLEQTSFLLESKEQQTESLSEELERERQQAISYFNALDKCREEVTELQVQLDLAKMENSGHSQKGNSLFGEVEDRRKEMERKMITMKVQLDSAKEQLGIKKQQIHKLKFQIAGLLQLGGGEADAAQVQRLEQALSQRAGEIQFLNTKIAELEQNQTGGFDQQLNDFCKTMMGQECGGIKVDVDLINFIKTKQKDANEKNEKLSAELKSQRLQNIMEKDNRLQTEKRLYASEVDADQLRAANMKLSLKLDELRAKYNIPDPDAPKKIKKFHVEKIPMPTDKKDEEPSETATESAAPAAETESKSPPHANEVSTLPSANEESHLSDITDNPTPVIPKLTRANKKSVTMCETVSVVDDTEKTEQCVNLKTGNEKSSVMKRSKPEDKPENEDPDVNGSKRKPRGRKCHNVVYMGSESEVQNECKQQ